MYVPQNFDHVFYTPGACLPAQNRSLNENYISWADATCHMGLYIAYLATEYRLLKDYGYNTEALKVEEDIAKALSSLERLDFFAEPYFSGPSKFNGYFIRDDVASSSQLETHFGENITFNSSYLRTPKTNNGMSQDQVTNLMLGFALVKKLCHDPSRPFHSKIYGYKSINQWVMKLTELYYTKAMIEENMYGLFWQIRNPVTLDMYRGCSWGDLLPYAGIYQWVYYKITDNFHPTTYPYLLGQTVPMPITEGYCLDLKLFNWKKEICFVDLSNKVYVDNQRLSLGTIAMRSHGANLYSIIKYCQKTGLYGETDYAFEHQPLIQLLLHEDMLHGFSPSTYYDYYDLIRFIEFLLDIAPEQGPHSDQGEADFTRHWSSISRLKKPHRTVLSQLSDGRFNGIDYLLLHNLYWLTYIKSSPLTLDVGTDYPVNHQFYDGDNAMLGTHDRPLKLDARNSIEVGAIVINSDANVSFRSDNILLNPGFEVKQGASFYAGPHPIKRVSYTIPAP